MGSPVSLILTHVHILTFSNKAIITFLHPNTPNSLVTHIPKITKKLNAFF
jgi:hypothetical protein